MSKAYVSLVVSRTERASSRLYMYPGAGTAAGGHFNVQFGRGGRGAQRLYLYHRAERGREARSASTTARTQRLYRRAERSREALRRISTKHKSARAVS